jgi:hypothetical protein
MGQRRHKEAVICKRCSKVIPKSEKAVMTCSGKAVPDSKVKVWYLCLKCSRHKETVAEKWATKSVKDMYAVLLKFTKRINSHKNPSSMGLTQDQVKKLVEWVVENLEGEGGGSYRTLIYHQLDGVGYADGMAMGLLDLNNALVQGCERQCKRRKYGTT